MTKETEKDKEVATTGDGGAVAAYDYADYGGAGTDDVGKADIAIPFIAILQSNSPQVEDENPKGSKAGMLFNTVTKELYAAAVKDSAVGLGFQPVYTEHMFVEWVPRDSGGGMIGQHAPDSEIVKDAIEKNGGSFGKLKNGTNDLIETFYVYGHVLDETGLGVLGFAVVSFSSTKIKAFKAWRTSMRMIKGRPPTFANRAKLRTVKQENEKGTFFNFEIFPFDDTSWASSLIPNVGDGKALIGAGMDLRQMITDGMARADFASADAAGNEGESPSTDGKAPF